MISHVKHLFLVVDHLYISVEKLWIQALCPFLFIYFLINHCLFLLLLQSSNEYVYPDKRSASIFSHFVGCLLTLLFPLIPGFLSKLLCLLAYSFDYLLCTEIVQPLSVEGNTKTITWNLARAGRTAMQCFGAILVLIWFY